jgi:hypothetical protein
MRHAVLIVVAVAVGSYYSWQARAANGPFAWGHDLNGFYDLLARGFLSGHLFTVVQPSPQLLALPNPWDPAVDDSLKWQDMVLYGGHYYLYFGAAPAVVLFAPWRIVTGHDLPENFAVWLLCFGGFLFACGSLLQVLELAEARVGPALLGVLFLALGLCQPAPFLLNRVAVYEVAIASGYFFVSGGIYFLSRALGRRSPVRDLAISGAMFGLAVASRPHLVLAGAIALAALGVFQWRRGERKFLAFAAAWAIVGLAIATYNYERFGNPVEFGFRYQLAGPGQNRVEVAPHNLVPGLYYTLLAPPEFSRVFPWIRMVFRFPFDSAELHPLPPQYFVEPTVGALWLAPFLLAAFAIRSGRSKRPAETRLAIGIAATAGIAVLLFLMSTHLASHRYEVDFVPLLVFAAVANLAVANRRVLTATACLLFAYSATANLALALAGPYDDYLHKRPARFVRLAKRFSPSREYRPALSPSIAVRIQARFAAAPAGYREPLVTIGHSHYCYFLYAERGAAALRLISKTNDSQMAHEMPEPGTSPVAISIVYSPASGEMAVTVDGREAVRHRVGTLVTAPAQVAVGENFADMGLTARRFTGEIRVLEKTVVEGAR